MASLSEASRDMQRAEMDVRAALQASTAGERCDALMGLYERTPARRRDALFAVVAARLTLVPAPRTSVCQDPVRGAVPRGDQ